MSLFKVYEPYFKMGVALPTFILNDEPCRRHILRHFNSITLENEMKPANILDMKKNHDEPDRYNFEPAIDFSKAERMLSFAKDNGINMRGHTLVWHNQTPEAFFHENYDENKPYLSREDMLKRLDGYIKAVLNYVQETYPGLIYAWDVVNEAIGDDHKGMRESNWTKVVGDDFVIEAFRIARKYVADGVKLFYNDYNSFITEKREAIIKYILKPLASEKLIDGMGMQSHFVMFDEHDSHFREFRKSLNAYGAIVPEIHSTELDIHNNDPGAESQQMLALKYKEFFATLLNAKKEGTANITSVTFWGLHDGVTWLSGFRKEKSYPLLFTDCLIPKDCYWGVVSIPGLFEGDVQDRLPHGQRFNFWEKDIRITKELHVNCNADNADDGNDGSKNRPFKTIQAAANIADAGTRVWIHAGEYRETVCPMHGGSDAEHMVVYEAVPGEEVIIKASEEVTEFKKSEGWEMRRIGIEADFDKVRIWEAKIDPDKYRGYNPFCAINMIHDRLYIEYDKTDMLTYLNRRGMVFCDGKPLLQVPLYCNMAEHEGSYWVEANGMTVHFRLPGDDSPDNHRIEFTCREQCFAPDIPFLSYIKVKGIICAHAATGAPVPQRGAISAYRGHHWVIENCTVDWSNCVGIDIGDECWHHTHEPRITGRSVVRGCTIKDVGVCGIAGLGASEMLIEDNIITGTGWQKMELSWEAGAIKLHFSVNGLIRRNIFKDTLRADHIWLDVENQNNRITANLFLDGIEQREAIFIECSRDDVNLIDNNIFWNVEGRFDPSKLPVEPGSTGWYKMSELEGVNGYAVYGEGTDHLQVVNNFIGNVRSAGYFQRPTSFRFGEFGMRGGTSRDASIVNNIFYDCKEAAIKFPTADNYSEGNVFTRQFGGGYLRVINPAPQTNLDLQAWKEFYGFDKKGTEARFKVDIDTEKFTMVFNEDDAVCEAASWNEKSPRMLPDPAALSPVWGYKGINSDFYGNGYSFMRIPGPFANIKSGEVISIDPRKQSCLS